jgi:hypothetical protein
MANRSEAGDSALLAGRLKLADHEAYYRNIEIIAQFFKNDTPGKIRGA